MNGVIKKKLNLLVHIAKLDGDFHKLEHEMILGLTEGLNIDTHVLESLLASNSSALPDANTFDDREEILYLALLMIQADRIITDEELAFCQRLATKLGFPKYTVDRFAHIAMPPLPDFRKQLLQWMDACSAKGVI